MSESKEVVNWADQLAKHAREAVAQVSGDTLNLSFRGGYMKLDGMDVPKSELDCIVLVNTFENQFYDPDIPFDPDNLQNPICYAKSLDGVDMEPSKASTKIQHNGLCQDCWAYQWKSDPVRKKGKACKEKVTLALLPASQLNAGGSVKKAALAIASISPTNVGIWADYVKMLQADYQRPPFAMLTKVICRPHSKKQLEITYQAIGTVADEYLSDIMERIPAAQAQMMREYEGKPDDPTKPTSENKKPKKY